MDYTRNFGAPAPAPLLPVYQDTRNSSPHWRQAVRVYHPLNCRQFGNRFRVGDSVRMRVLYPNNGRVYTNLNIVNIIPYEFANLTLGSYNGDDAFKGEPFAHVLVLEP
jgi:hypothetical protein